MPEALELTFFPERLAVRGEVGDDPTGAAGPSADPDGARPSGAEP
jgi:hypothetical protein